ncbi:MAG: hypothetical protein NTW50_02075 [Candidatus Berkelbacteria bacterium]|nr:hypothetical protein [Candidatus Berkelbacteria bacterium]
MGKNEKREFISFSTVSSLFRNGLAGTLNFLLRFPRIAQKPEPIYRPNSSSNLEKALGLYREY